jgi:hypothetical protein
MKNQQDHQRSVDKYRATFLNKFFGIFSNGVITIVIWNLGIFPVIKIMDLIDHS